MTSIAKSSPAGGDGWHHRMIRTGFFMGAVLLHLIIFLLVARWVVFQPLATESESHFQRIAIPPPQPAEPPPPPSGGDVANNLEPREEVSPPAAMPSVVVSVSPSLFSVNSVKVTLPNLPASVSKPAGTGLSGQTAPGPTAGSGTPFGSSDSNGAPLLQGFLYDLKQTADRKPTGMTPPDFHKKIKQFIAENWNPQILDAYYRSPKPLYASSLFIPTLSASDGPKAFGVEKDVEPNMYVIWYKFRAAPTEEGTYHFVGVADDILLVRADGRTVLDGCLHSVVEELRDPQKKIAMPDFNPTIPEDGDFWIGSPLHLAAGQQVDIDILIGEEPGGYSNYFLYMLRDEATYTRQANGGPLLPVFQLNSDPIHPTGPPGSFPPHSPDVAPWQAAESRP